MAKKICDFCLEEQKGLFSKTMTLPGGQCLCKKCRKKMEDYGLPVKYDLFQLLVCSDDDMNHVIMKDWLDHHDARDVLAQYYPIHPMPLHEGEHLINTFATSITVDPSRIPESKAEDKITEIRKSSILNLPDFSGGTQVSGMVYQTDAAIYFLSEHFINCHRLSNLVRDNADKKNFRILEKGNTFTYPCAHSDLWLLREEFYEMATLIAENEKANLIYLASDNTMTLTSGVYHVPRNIKSGTYWVSPLDNADISIQDAGGKIEEVREGRLRIDNGSKLEVSGSVQFRFRKKKPQIEKTKRIPVQKNEEEPTEQ